MSKKFSPDKDGPMKASPAKSAYEVGHGKPPKHTQFQPGKSGNPNGRPDMKRPHAVVIDDALNRTIMATLDGRRRQVTIFEAMFLQMVQGAINGDARARRDLLKYAKDFGYTPPPIGFSTVMQAWVGMEGLLPDSSLQWLVDTDRVCEALRKAGAITVEDDGAIRMTDGVMDRLLGPDLPAGKRRELLRHLKPLLSKD